MNAKIDDDFMNVFQHLFLINWKNGFNSKLVIFSHKEKSVPKIKTLVLLISSDQKTNMGNMQSKKTKTKQIHTVGCN